MMGCKNWPSPKEEEAHLIHRQPIVFQISALLIESMPGLMYGTCQTLCEVVWLEACGNPDVARVRPCATTL